VIHVASKLLLVALALPQSAPASYSGFAASYSLGTMELVARNRHMSPEPCMVASFRLPLERHIEVLGLKTGVSRRCKVVDVCHPRDCKRILARGIRVELDYGSNKAICGATREPPSYCPVRVTEVP
jgi:hypothetical protein